MTLFLADAVFAPGASTGELAHEGPLGLVIEGGTLDVLSPSGLTGQLQQGVAVVLPATAPLVASNAGPAEAVVLFAGVVATGGSLLAEITPTAVPTEVPTPTSTAVPTEAPTPTQMPPTPTPPPVAGTVLFEATGEDFANWPLPSGWSYVSGMVVYDGSFDGESVLLAPFEGTESRIT